MTLCSSDLMSQRHKYSRNLGETCAAGTWTPQKAGVCELSERLVLQLSEVRSGISSKRKYQPPEQTAPATKQAA